MLHDPVNKIIHIRVDIIGDSQSSKPTDVPVNSTYYEVDTMNFYIFYGGEWILQAFVEETEPANDSEEDPPAENDSEPEAKQEEKKEPEEEPQPEEPQEERK